MAFGVCTNCVSSFPPSTGQKWKILQIFFDIVTTHNDKICYVKHVLAPLYVFFTLFGCWGGGGGASVWLKQRRRWRATTLGWSIHKENKKLDRAGEAKKSTYNFLSMDALIELVHFSLLQDNIVLAAGEPWCRSGAVPMGGPFSAESADLHYVRCCKKFVHLLHRMGAMSLTADGILQRALPDGNTVALQQLRDNVMVAAKGPTPHLAMYPVCQALEEAWNLHVLCPFCDNNPSAVCRGSCMGTSVRCMGVTVYVSTSAVFCHSHPNALDAQGQLKFGAPLQTLRATNTRRTTNVFLSAFSNTPIPTLMGRVSVVMSPVDAVRCPFWVPHPRRAHLHVVRCTPPFGKNTMGRRSDYPVDSFHRAPPAAVTQ